MTLLLKQIRKIDVYYVQVSRDSEETLGSRSFPTLASKYLFFQNAALH